MIHNYRKIKQSTAQGYYNKLQTILKFQKYNLLNAPEIDFHMKQLASDKYIVHYEDMVQQQKQKQIKNLNQTSDKYQQFRINLSNAEESIIQHNDNSQSLQYENSYNFHRLLQQKNSSIYQNQIIDLQSKKQEEKNQWNFDEKYKIQIQNFQKHESSIDGYYLNKYIQRKFRIDLIEELPQNFQTKIQIFNLLQLFLQINILLIDQVYQYLQFYIQQKPNLQYPFFIKIKNTENGNQFRSNFLKNKVKYYFKIQQLQIIQNELQIYKFSVEQLSQTIKFLQKQIIRQLKQKSSQIVEQMNIILSQQSIISLRQQWKSFCYDFLNTILSNTQVYYFQTHKALKNLIHIYYYKSFQKQKIYQRICPGINGIMNKLAKELKIQLINNSFKKYLDIFKERDQQISHQSKVQNFLRDFNVWHKLSIKKYSTPLDQIFFNFILQSNQNLNQSKTLKFLVNFQNTKIPLSSFISSYPQFYTGLSNWLDLFTQFQFQRKEAYKKLEVNEFALLYQQNKSTLLEEIQYELLPDHRCLGCSSFFYLGSNIEDNSISIAPIDCLSSIMHLKDHQFNILKVVSAYLNSGGGLIFFDAKRQYRKTLAYGTILNEASKQKIKQQIEKLILSRIVPKVDIKYEIRIDFVPIKQSPYRAQRSSTRQKYNSQMALLRPDQYYQSREYLKGLFMTRIKISPNDSSKLYGINNQLEVIHYTRENGKIVPLVFPQIIKVLKKKIKKFLIKDNEKQNRNIFTYIQQNIFDHECKNPQKGQVIYQNIEPPQDSRKQFQYEQMFLIIARSKNLPQIQARLTQQDYTSSIQQKFQKYRFKSTKHTAVMYINASYDQVIKNITNNPYFNFQDKMLLALLITTHIRYGNDREQKQMTRQHFNNLKSWISKQYPFQVIKFYQYLIENQNNSIAPKKEYYFETQTKTCCLFLYYILHHFSQPSLMKDPKNLSNLSKEDRQRRWKLIFSSVNMNQIEPISLPSNQYSP